MAGPVLSIAGVTKEFRLGWRGFRVRAVDDFSLELSEGQIFGLLGPNGSGKSTILRIGAGLLSPDRGRCSVLKAEVKSVQAKRIMGYLPDRGGFYPHLTGRESLEMFAEVGGLTREESRRRVLTVLTQFELVEPAERRVDSYSKGMLQRLALARVQLLAPKLLLLDEPFSGLDPLAIRSVMKSLKGLAETGVSILFTSHLLTRVEELCDMVGILNRGKLLVSGTVDEVLATGRVATSGMDEVYIDHITRAATGGGQGGRG